jgi:methylated-DNA-[protein]-cysteine S-methyltransferase
VQHLAAIAMTGEMTGGMKSGTKSAMTSAAVKRPAAQTEAIMFNAVIDAPFGKVGIRTGGEAVREIVYLSATTASVEPDCVLAERAAEQIARYFDDASVGFDLPLAARGTPFQQRVWQGISAIGAGGVLTYGELAKRIGSDSARAVGQACGSNPFPLVIPCHRVVSASGIGGFAHHGGEGFFRDVKRWLLAHEGVAFR